MRSAFHIGDLTADGVRRLTILDESFAALREQIEAACPESPERKEALWHLRQAAEWVGRSLRQEAVL